jgi:glycosyltransferase involved in cell wall biosynthesis
MSSRFVRPDENLGLLPRVEVPRRVACVVVPMHNESANLDALVSRLREAAEQLHHWELRLLLVDDGSRDDSILKVKAIRAAGTPVGYLQLSRNFGHQAALQAGLLSAPGDVVITMDADLQHPPEMIPGMIERYEAGYDVVQMVREQSAGGSKGLFSTLFYKSFNSLADTRIIPDASDFRLLSRRFLDVLNRIPEREKFLRGLIPSLGFRQTTMPYEQAQRLHGSPSYTFRKSLKLARKALFDFSTVPLQCVFACGWMLAVGSFVFGITSVVIKLINWHTVAPGYTDIIVAICFLSGCILASVGILGRYLMMILDQLRGRIRVEPEASRRRPGPSR